MNADLVAFVTVRLDEDEQWAREAPPRGWYATDNHVEDQNGGSLARFEIKADARHAAHFDPQRQLADIAAKRRILALCDLWFNDADQPVTLGGYGEAYWDVVRLLAVPYAEHPDYQQEWQEWEP